MPGRRGVRSLWWPFEWPLEWPFVAAGGMLEDYEVESQLMGKLCVIIKDEELGYSPHGLGQS
jgi:hypothetical protein